MMKLLTVVNSHRRVNWNVFWKFSMRLIAESAIVHSFLSRFFIANIYTQREHCTSLCYLKNSPRNCANWDLPYARLANLLLERFRCNCEAARGKSLKRCAFCTTQSSRCWCIQGQSSTFANWSDFNWFSSILASLTRGAFSVSNYHGNFSNDPLITIHATAAHLTLNAKNGTFCELRRTIFRLHIWI